MKQFLSIIILSYLILTRQSLCAQNNGSYISKTYSFKSYQGQKADNSQFSNSNYYRKDSVVHNKLMRRLYPNYMNKNKRIEYYKYYEDGSPFQIIIKTYAFQTLSSIDTFLYDKPDSNTIILTKNSIQIQVQRMSNDTVYNDKFMNGNFLFTYMQFWEDDYKKHDQIITPEPSSIVNVYIHNEYGDLIGIEKFNKGISEGKSMWYEYQYDSSNRVISKDTYMADYIEDILWEQEITVYEDK